jgi:hypothetical protein
MAGGPDICPVAIAHASTIVMHVVQWRRQRSRDCDRSAYRGENRWKLSLLGNSRKRMRKSVIAEACAKESNLVNALVMSSVQGLQPRAHPFEDSGGQRCI